MKPPFRFLPLLFSTVLVAGFCTVASTRPSRGRSTRVGTRCCMPRCFSWCGGCCAGACAFLGRGLPCLPLSAAGRRRFTSFLWKGTCPVWKIGTPISWAWPARRPFIWRAGGWRPCRPAWQSGMQSWRRSGASWRPGGGTHSIAAGRSKSGAGSFTGCCSLAASGAPLAVANNWWLI